MSPRITFIEIGDSATFTATDNNGSAALCNWYDEDGNLLQSNASSFTYTVNEYIGYNIQQFTAKLATDESIVSYGILGVSPSRVVLAPTSANVYAGNTQKFTATDGIGNNVTCKWYVDDVELTDFGGQSTVYIPFDNVGNYTVKAASTLVPEIFATASVTVTEYVLNISPTSATVTEGETVTFTTTDATGAPAYSFWYVGDDLLTDIQLATSADITFSTAGTYTVRAQAQQSFSTSAYATVTVNASSGGGGETDPDTPTDCNCVTPEELAASQASQTNTIVSKIESESTILLTAIEALETSLSNSEILTYFKQTLSFRDFNFTTGSLSTSSQSYEGIVPLFGHWAQNVEDYLGRIVATLANDREEEVVEKTGGFWDLLIGLFTPDTDGKSKADSDDMNEIVDFSDDVSSMISAGGQLSDFVTVLSAESTWSLFSDEASSSLDSVPQTYSFRGPRYYHRADNIYSDFYTQVLGREMED